MGTKDFTGMLQNKLMSCCRKHGIQVVATCTSESQRCNESFNSWHTDVNGEPDPPVSEKFTEVFQIEEECYEAILDTGASRAVIGSQRLEGLIKSCGVGGEIKRAPSSVTFRFGNSGTLQSTFVVFFPRKLEVGSELKLCRVEHHFCCQTQFLGHYELSLILMRNMCGSKGFEEAFP